MDSRKVSLFATIAVIALVAVGIGFAYTAMTTNQGNTASPEYITIVQGESGAYQFANDTSVYWNTNDYKITNAEDPHIDGGIALGDMITIFTMNNGSTTDVTPADEVTYTTAKIGNSFTVKYAPESGGNALSGLKCVVSTDVSGGFPVQANDAVIFLKFTTTGQPDQYLKLTAANTFNSWDGDSWDGPSSINVYNPTATTYADTTVSVYYGFAGTSGIVVEHAVGIQPEGPSEKPVNNANLKFTVDTGLQNNPASPVC